MTLQVLTPIYPPHIKPVREGRYLTAPTDGKGISKFWSLRYWDGRDWCTGWGDSYQRQDVWSWYGLAFDPDSAEDCTEFSFNEDPVSVGVFLPGATCC